MFELRPPIWRGLRPSDLFSALASPPDRYRPVPWLAMTGNLDWPTVEHSLQEMHDKGITEFFLFAIYGMEIPYMSEAYWSLVERMLQFCQANDMKCWIYDEYNWPSGICAGEVIRDHPEYRAKQLHLRIAAEEGKVAPPPDADAVGENGGVSWAVVPSLWNTLITGGSDWCNAVPGYLDVLNVDGTRRFIEATHDRYYSRFAAAFPEVLPGFFTDEPGMYARWGAKDTGWLQLPYTDDLFESFRAQYGYDLRDRLEDMLVDSETARRTRCHYWRWIAERFGEAYGRQTRAWCDAHRVLLTGHGLGEEALLWHVSFSGDLWEILRHFTIPGIDMLANAEGFNFPYRIAFYPPEEKRGFHLTCKFVHSVARHSGTREMMSEAYGVCDWGMNLYRQKCGFNYQVALGVTLFNDNTLITSIADLRKWVVAGKHFTQPWWPYYKRYADYNARLAAIHAEGEPVAPIAILYPRSAIWAKYGPNPPLEPLQTQLYELLDELIRRQWHFDFVFEPVLAAAHVEGPDLVTEHARYRALIVPSATDLPQACMDALEEFARSGGIVLLSGDLPEREVDSQAGLASQVGRILASSQARHVSADSQAVCRALEDTQLRRPFTLGSEGAREFVSSWRKLAGNDILFIANMAEAAADVDIELHLEGPFMVCDPDTLERYRPTVGDGRRFRWHFEPWQAYLIIAGESARIADEPLSPAPAWLAAEQVHILDGKWGFDVKPGNMLHLDMEVRPDPDNCGTTNGWFRDTGEAGWIRTVDGRRLPRPLLPQETPWYWLRGTVDCETVDGPRLVVCDNPDFLAVYVNGRAAEPVHHRPLWAEENLWFDVRGLFREGRNMVCVRAKTSKYNDPRIGPFPDLAKLLQPVVLVGDFLVQEGHRLVPWTGAVRVDQPWEQQGLPHFAGTGTCQCAFDWDGRGRLLLRLPKCTDAVEVHLNGKLCGVRTWPPYVFDLTPRAARGTNCLEIRIRNTLGNMITETYAGMVPTERPSSGLLQPPRLLQVT